MRRILPDRPLTQAERNKRHYEKHKEAELERNRLYCQENKQKVAAQRRLYKHRMTKDEHDVKLQEQQNCCAICHEPFVKTPHIDHCHETNQNRGLLCEDCNLGLGRFKDDPKILRSAIQYLEKWNVRNS